MRARRSCGTGQCLRGQRRASNPSCLPPLRRVVVAASSRRRPRLFLLGEEDPAEQGRRRRVLVAASPRRPVVPYPHPYPPHRYHRYPHRLAGVVVAACRHVVVSALSSPVYPPILTGILTASPPHRRRRVIVVASSRRRRCVAASSPRRCRRLVVAGIAPQYPRHPRHHPPDLNPRLAPAPHRRRDGLGNSVVSVLEVPPFKPGPRQRVKGGVQQCRHRPFRKS